jgi:hypothetical protein
MAKTASVTVRAVALGAPDVFQVAAALLPEPHVIWKTESGNVYYGYYSHDPVGPGESFRDIDGTTILESRVFVSDAEARAWIFARERMLGARGTPQ